MLITEWGLPCGAHQSHSTQCVIMSWPNIPTNYFYLLSSSHKLVFYPTCSLFCPASCHSRILQVSHPYTSIKAVIKLLSRTKLRQATTIPLYMDLHLFSYKATERLLSLRQWNSCPLIHSWCLIKGLSREKGQLHTVPFCDQSFCSNTTCQRAVPCTSVWKLIAFKQLFQR